MKGRTIIFIGLVAALAAALPSPALASSLLSGYGGPGEGNQAILGSALVNGPGGGSGGSSSASESSPSRSGNSAAPTGASAGAPPGATRRSGSAGSASGARATPSSTGGSGRPGGSRDGSAGGQSFYPVSERIPAGEQPGALALSGADLLYLILALGVLVLIGVLTRRLARTGAAEKLGS